MFYKFDEYITHCTKITLVLCFETQSRIQICYFAMSREDGNSM